jgi:hypothetical protein
LTASGLESPEYLLAFVPVQEAVLRAANTRLDRAALEAALAGTPSFPARPTAPTSVRPRSSRSCTATRCSKPSATEGSIALAASRPRGAAPTL